jgi:hypothetical protein
MHINRSTRDPEKLVTHTGYTIRGKPKPKQNIIYVLHHYAIANTNRVNKTWTLLQNKLELKTTQSIPSH